MGGASVSTELCEPDITSLNKFHKIEACYKVIVSSWWEKRWLFGFDDASSCVFHGMWIWCSIKAASEAEGVLSVPSVKFKPLKHLYGNFIVVSGKMLTLNKGLLCEHSRPLLIHLIAGDRSSSCWQILNTLNCLITITVRPIVVGVTTITTTWSISTPQISIFVQFKHPDGRNLKITRCIYRTWLGGGGMNTRCGCSGEASASVAALDKEKIEHKKVELCPRQF